MFNTTFEIQFDLINDEPSNLKDVRKERLSSWDEIKSIKAKISRENIYNVD